MFNALRRIVAVVMACGLIPLVGCTPPDGSIGGGVSVNTQTGATTVSVTGTLTWHHQKLQQIAVMMPAPLSGTDLASLDVSQAIFTYSLSNATITSTTGTVTVTVTDDATGAIVGKQDFAYDVRGTSLYAHDPAAVSNWLQQFTPYSVVDVDVVANTNMKPINTAVGSSVTNNAVYQGITYSSSSASWTTSPISGGTCHTRICPLQ
jgi:hypothetical protein